MADEDSSGTRSSAEVASRQVLANYTCEIVSGLQKFDLRGKLHKLMAAFQAGWKREVVKVKMGSGSRTSPNSNPTKGRGRQSIAVDYATCLIYYYSPTGEKLKTPEEVAEYLSNSPSTSSQSQSDIVLTLENFAFAPIPICVTPFAKHETVRIVRKAEMPPPRSPPKRTRLRKIPQRTVINKQKVPQQQSPKRKTRLAIAPRRLLPRALSIAQSKGLKSKRVVKRAKPFSSSTSKSSSNTSSISRADEVFEIEQIIDKKVGERGKVSYLVKWKNYPAEEENTWEPARNLFEDCPELVRSFEKEHHARSQSQNQETVPAAVAVAPLQMEGVAVVVQVNDDEEPTRNTHVVDTFEELKLVEPTTTPSPAPPVGFARGLEPEEVMGVAKHPNDGVLCVLIKWKDKDIYDIVPAEEANLKCPQLVIELYENITKWRDLEGGAGEGEPTRTSN